MQENELQAEIQKMDVGDIEIINVEDFNYANRIVLDLIELKKKINHYWDIPIKKAHEAHKSLISKKKEMLSPIEKKEKVIRSKTVAYLTEQNRKKQEEQRKLDEQRRKQEEAEKRKIEKRADKAEESGKLEKAEMLRDKLESIYIPPAIVESDIKKTTHLDCGSVTQKTDIEVTIIDVDALLKAVVDKNVPLSIVDINIRKLKNYIKHMGIKEMDGCDIKEIVNPSYRGKS